MNDNSTHTGSNWDGQAPRTMKEAFGGGRLHGAKRRSDWLNIFLDGCMLALAVIVLALAYKIGVVVGF